MRKLRKFELIRRHTDDFESVLERAMARAMQPSDIGESPFSRSDLESAFLDIRDGSPLESFDSGSFSRLGLEAIIELEMRPPWLICNDEIVIGGSFDRTDAVLANKSALEAIARNVGRLDLLNHGGLPFAGTGWLIDDDMVATNAHVARIFASQGYLGDWRLRDNQFGDELRIELNPRRQHEQDRVPPREFKIREVLFGAGSNRPDIAFLRIDKGHNMTPLTPHLGHVKPDEPVAAIGYPAHDNRNDLGEMDRIFGGVYAVKRFSPGYVDAADPYEPVLYTDYSSLGGNSGSCVVHVESGGVVGLHFGGKYRETNVAVEARTVYAALREVRVRAVGGAAIPPPVSATESPIGRKGYDPEFLGGGDLAVPFPDLGPFKTDLAKVSDAADNVLRYTHFSVLQSRSRRLPMLTAVNIDGAKAWSLKRNDNWRLDGRISADHQVGNDLYLRNPLDRGHMVRRQDPGWGETEAEAQQGEDDTFYYTNAAPQHKELNQGHWVELEDYILENAKTLGFRANIMTGPIFGVNDRPLKDQKGADDVRIPLSFWKLAAMVNADNGKLSVTAYILDQGDLVRDLTEAAFLYGVFRTYQVRVASLKEKTGLDFGGLARFDPMDSEAESIFGQGVRPIKGPWDLTL